MLVQHPGRQSAGPFIEIAEHDAWPRPFGVAEDGLSDQFTSLMPPLDKGGPEVNVINMQPGLFFQTDVDAQTTPLFAPGHADVMIFRLEQRETAEHEVAVN